MDPWSRTDQKQSPLERAVGVIFYLCAAGLAALVVLNFFLGCGALDGFCVLVAPHGGAH